MDGHHTVSISVAQVFKIRKKLLNHYNSLLKKATSEGCKPLQASPWSRSRKTGEASGRGHPGPGPGPGPLVPRAGTRVWTTKTPTEAKPGHRWTDASRQVGFSSVGSSGEKDSSLWPFWIKVMLFWQYSPSDTCLHINKETMGFCWQLTGIFRCELATLFTKGHNRAKFRAKWKRWIS